MTVESVLLLVFLIGVPILEWLVRALRARAQRAQELAVSSPQPPPPSIPTPDIPPPGIPSAAIPAPSTPPPAATPPVLPVRHPAAERLSASDTVRARRTSERAASSLAMRSRSLTPHRRHDFSLTKRADLRRAMVLMAILGPCKALESEARSVTTRT